MTTHRQRVEHGLRGVEVQLHTTTVADNFTTLANTVLRGEFHRPDGAQVILAAGPRCALYALLSYGTDLRNPAYRLKMDDFVAGFKEKTDTVYRWIRILEDEGFVHRWRANDPATGHFVWTLAVWDSPRALAAVTDVKPQVGPSLQKGGDGAAPPVDNLKTRRSHHPYKSPGWVNPSTDNPDTATLYREISSSYLPASSCVSDAREDQNRGEGESKPFATTGPPRLVSVSWTERTDDETRLVHCEEWARFIVSLTNAAECQGKVMPTRMAQETLAIRAQVAHERRGWTIDQLRRYLLGGLRHVDHLAGVWGYRLYPEHLPLVPGRPVAPGMESAGDLPTEARRREIQAEHGLVPGTRRLRGVGGGAG